MRVVCIAGSPETREFALAIHLAVMAKSVYPPFHFRTFPKPAESFQRWVGELCREEMWEEVHEPVLCWYELHRPGGPKVLIGGLFPYFEFMSSEYGVARDISLQELDQVVAMKKEEMKTFAEYEKALESLKSILVISVVAAGSNRAVSSLLYSLLRLKGLRIHDGLIIRLFDRFEGRYDKLKEIQKKFNILENRMGYGFVKIAKNFEELVKDTDILIFLGDNFRTEEMDVEKYLYGERVLYGVYGVLCNKYLPKKTKVVFVSMDNACFNATSFLDRGVSVNPKNVAVVTSYLASEVRTYISQVGGFPLENIVKIPVWGMVDLSHVVDVAKGQLLFRYPDLESADFPNFEALMEKCEPGMRLFLRLAMSQKEARDAAREIANMEDVLRMTYDKYFEKEEALRQKLHTACDIQFLADQGEALAKIAARDIWEEIIKMHKEGKQDTEHNVVGQTKEKNLVKDTVKSGVEQSPEGNELPQNKEKKNEDAITSDETECFLPNKKLNSKLEMRSLQYIVNSLRNMWDYIGVAKNAVRKHIGQDPFISQVRELENLLQIWVLDPVRKNEVTFVGIVSDGSYGLQQGMVLSQPAVVNAKNEWEVFQDEGRQDLQPPGDGGPEGLPALLNLAKLTLHHFLISPEIETVDDLLEKRLNDMDYVDWRLEKLQAEYEYNELGKMNADQYDLFAKNWLKSSMFGEGGPHDEGDATQPEKGAFKENVADEEYPDAGECGASSRLSKYLQQDDSFSKTEGDQRHIEYLRSVGFWLDDNQPPLGREYDPLIKKAFLEIFCNEEPKFEDEKEDSKEKFSSAATSCFEGHEGGAEELERPIGSLSGQMNGDDVPIRLGIGARLDIENDLNINRNISNPVVEDNFSTLPKIDQKHEYEKPYTRKYGFPLDLQGKCLENIASIYKDLLLVDAERVKECFNSLASRVNGEFESDSAKSYKEKSMNSSVDNVIIDNLTDEEDVQTSELQLDGSRCSEIIDENEMEYEGDSLGEISSRKSFVTFSNDTSVLKSGEKPPSFTIQDPLQQKVSSPPCLLDIWREPERKEQKNALDAEPKLYEKAILLGALKIQMSDEGNAQREEEQIETQTIRDEMESTYAFHGKDNIIFSYQGKDCILSHQKVKEEIEKTQKEIKASCSSFLEFVRKFRKTNALYDAYEGVTDPEIAPFPKKSANETYSEFKTRTINHAHLIRNAKERTEAIKKKNLKYYEEICDEKCT